MRKTILAIAAIAVLAGCGSAPTEADAFESIRANAQTTDTLSLDDAGLRTAMQHSCEFIEEYGIPQPERMDSLIARFNDGSAIDRLDDFVLVMGNAVGYRCPEFQDEFDNTWGVKFAQVTGD